jgi:8-oxo-dGTP pyrophosphatase MutT (NUDIX family)
VKQWAERISQALTLTTEPPPRPRTGASDKARPAAVLVIFGFHEGGRDPSVLITRRTETVESHKGQMAFPGGVRDPEDASAEVTALRETEEEVGIARGDVEVLGQLPRMWTLTGFSIEPYVGLLKRPIEGTKLHLSAGEIAEAFWVPFNLLNDPATYREEPVQFEGRTFPMHVYQVQGHRVWGATAFILKNLLDRLSSIGVI